MKYKNMMCLMIKKVYNKFIKIFFKKHRNNATTQACAVMCIYYIK